MKIPAIVMAGGECTPELYEATREREKAFVKVGGRPLVEHMVRCLSGAESVGAITIVGNVERLKAQFPDLANDAFLPHERSLFENLMKGLKAVSNSDRALVCACDTPLLTREMVEWLIGQCADPQIDFYYPISEKGLVEKRFPGMKRTYVNLRDGAFTGGNLMVMNPKNMLHCEVGIREAIALRKSPLKLAGRMGFGFLLRLLARQLSIQQAELQAGRLLGIRAKTVISPFPEMGCDLDKASDYRVFEGILGPR